MKRIAASIALVLALAACDRGGDAPAPVNKDDRPTAGKGAPGPQPSREQRQRLLDSWTANANIPVESSVEYARQFGLRLDPAVIERKRAWQTQNKGRRLVGGQEFMQDFGMPNGPGGQPPEAAVSNGNGMQQAPR